MLLMDGCFAFFAWALGSMQALGELLELAVRADKAWRRASGDDRCDALANYAAHDALIVTSGACDLQLWDYPRAVAQRIVLDEGCREEARRRNHEIDPPFAIAVAQAQSLADYRSSLEQALAAIEDWASFMTTVRTKAACE